jgi:hypothetical protein
MMKKEWYLGCEREKVIDDETANILESSMMKWNGMEWDGMEII